MLQTPTLSSLLEESKQLTTHLSQADIPNVHRGIDLLESESRKLVARSVRGGRVALDPRAQSLLAGAGVDAEAMAETNASAALLSAFETMQPAYDANVETFLAQQQEQSIVNAIEESELATLDDFDRHLTDHMEQMWMDTQQRLFEELGQYQGAEPQFFGMADQTGSLAAGGSGAFNLTDTRAHGQVTQPRVERYTQVVRKLNDARVAGTVAQFDLLGSLEKATQDSSVELKSKQIGQVWKLLAHYTAQSAPRDIARGACQYLEETFIDHVDRIVAQYPHDANVGGIPSVQRKVQGYLNVQFGRLGRAPTFLEVFNGEAIWAHMYTLYRCGYKQELLRYALDMEDIITDSDPGFVAHLKAFCDKTTATRVGVSVSAASLEDPYKAALFKVLGRGAAPKKAAAEVVQTTEDYLWSSLAVIRDADQIATATGHPRNTLASLQVLMLKFGPAHFDPTGNNPLLYLRVLLLCGLFENAVDYLLQVDRYQIEGVHIAIALVFYGLLRIPSADTSAGALSGYLAVEDGDQTALNIARVLTHYAHALPQTDDAISYLLLLTLGTSEATAARQHDLCQREIVRTLYECADYAKYVGDIQSDGTRRRGLLERYMPLLGITSNEQFAQAIICRLADRSRDEGRLADTVLLYNLAERYNTVLSVLGKQLGELLHVYGSGSVDSGSDLNGLDDVEGVSRAVLEYYREHEHIARVLDKRATATCTTLLSIVDFLSLHRRGAFEEALEAIERTQLLPLEGDISLVSQHAEQVRGLDDAITRNFSLILLAAMDTLSRLHAGLKESPFMDAVKQVNLQTLQHKSRALMVFAGMIQFRMPSDTYAKLNRMDIFMH
ncbi:nuclear pore complex subunit [Coemansia sp. RSA 2611]|nr:nuclear pore complex subunit [Coemansia sp. RSA 2611]